MCGFDIYELWLELGSRTHFTGSGSSRLDTQKLELGLGLKKLGSVSLMSQFKTIWTLTNVQAHKLFLSNHLNLSFSVFRFFSTERPSI